MKRAFGIGLVVWACATGCGDGAQSASSASTQPAATTAAATTTTAAPTATPKPTPEAPGMGALSGIAGPATEEGAKAIIKELQTATDPLAVAKKLVPTLADLQAIFNDDALARTLAEKAEKAAAGDKGNDFPKGEPEVFCASSDDMIAAKKEVMGHFPGGYKRVGPKLKPGLTLCKFKIAGIAIDALVNVKGNWVIVSKPFREIKE